MRFAALTIGRKIVVGFAVVFLLLGAVTMTGYLALGAAGKKFASYASRRRPMRPGSSRPPCLP